ncbi:hypothetical protein [Aureivirga sp. CE67]|uniref:hypothetical protein n=1 Tax=Aureivirga sp. CE67 TaxID=1788983 RepID=UPI0018CA4564|nr:hypothetical protein [Aureivirga sp. CE67]
MKKLSIIILFSLVLIACGNISEKDKPASSVRTEIFDREFENSEVVSIDLVEIEHPMLGGIVEEIKLDNSQKEKFLSDFDKLKKRGLMKCKAKYVVRLNMKKDTLRLKVCGKTIANRYNDFYYELENDKNIIEEYLN